MPVRQVNRVKESIMDRCARDYAIHDGFERKTQYKK